MYHGVRRMAYGGQGGIGAADLRPAGALVGRPGLAALRDTDVVARNRGRRSQSSAAPEQARFADSATEGDGAPCSATQSDGAAIVESYQDVHARRR